MIRKCIECGFEGNDEEYEFIDDGGNTFFCGNCADAINKKFDKKIGFTDEMKQEIKNETKSKLQEHSLKEK